MTHTLSQVEEQAHTLIERLAAISIERYGRAPKVLILWDLKGLRGGLCQYDPSTCQSTIRLNRHLAQHEGEAYKPTIAHEYAHAVIFMRCAMGILGRGRVVRAHGLEWQSVMLAFGVAPKRCHNYASAEAARKVTRYTYHCNCREHKVTSIIRNKILKGASYQCARCHSKITEVTS